MHTFWRSEIGTGASTRLKEWWRPSSIVAQNDDEPDALGWQESVQSMHRELQVQFAQRESEIVDSTKSFLPRILQRPLVVDNNVVVMHRCTGCVVFSDASGFTKLTETLAQRADGAEVLSKSLNKFFTPLIDIIEAYRGDVIKFSGDALSILFEATDDYDLHPCPCGSPGSARKTPQQLACLRASACCLEIHKRLHNFDTGEGGVRLTLHIGVGAGSIALLQVGGEHGRYEYVIAGTPMEQIAIAEPLAGSGETVLSPDTWKEVAHTVIEGDPLIAEGSEGFHRLAAFDTEQHTYPTVKQAALECSRIETSRMEVVEDAVLLRQSARFIPRAVLKHLRSGNSTSVNEMRSVTIIFVQIGGVDVSTAEGSKIAQKLMVSMQKACYNLEGNLNKFLVDDKGLLFLFVFGLPPVVHIDDPSRAIAACFEMVSALKSMNLVGRFGVTTGRVFCGIVGSNKRREYTVMGDTVNLSARLMANAPENSVLVDEATYLRSRRDISCEKLDPIKVKGKANAIPIFKPNIPTVHGLVVSQLGGALGQRGWNLDQTQLQVPSETAGGQSLKITMPWRALSQQLGGNSPMLKLSRWKELQRVEQLLAEPRGFFSVGGSVLLYGSTGIGKQELSEHLIHKGMAAGLIPVFGFQRTRDAEQWRAVGELVQDCLLTLSRGRGQAEGAELGDVAETLLERFVKPDDNVRRVLAFLGFEGFEVPNERGTTKMGSMDTSDGSEVFEAGAVRLAVRLVEAVAEHCGVLVTLRIRRGTDVFDALEISGRCSLFWTLSSELSKIAVQRRRQILGGATLKPIVVVTVTRRPRSASRHGNFSTATSAESFTTGQTPPPIASVPTPQQEGRATFEVALNPLTEDAAVELMCHCLGLSTADGGALVKRRLREFISAVSINIPAYIQDCIEQLLSTSAVSVSGGECKVEVEDLNAVDIAEWVHTSMVGGTISTLESLGPAKQHIMKMGTVFDGPFSPLDLAATNRVLYGRLPKTLSFYDMSKLLSSCSELVKQGLLTRVTLLHATPADRAPALLPRWTISNTLVRRVAGSMVLNSYRILLKRAVLIERALNVWLPKRMGVAQAKGDKNRLTRLNKALSKDGKADQPPKVASGHARSPFAPLNSEEVSTMPDETKQLLCQGCLLGNLNVVLEILTKNSSFDLSFTGVGGYTPLHFACSSGQVDIVSLLCDHGAIVDAQSQTRETPLLVAAQRGHLEVVQYLCETQRALTASLRDCAYWEKMLPDIQGEADIPSPLTDVTQAPAYSHEVLNHRRREIFRFIQTQFEESMRQAEVSFTTSPSQPLGPTDSSASRRPSLATTEKLSASEALSAGGTTSRSTPLATTLPSLRDVFKNTISVPSQEAARLQMELQADAQQAQASTGFDGKSSMTKGIVKQIQSHYIKDLRTKIRVALRSRPGLVFMLVALGLALYMPDIWVSSGAPGNTGIDVILTIVMVLFLSELVLLSLVDSSYPLSFFFFMDCVGTISMIWDISYLLGSDATKPQENVSNQSDLTLFRATRTAKIGARAGRLSRLVKIMRFLPGIGISRGKQDEAAQLAQISNQLTNVLSKRVACLTILLVIVLPLFTIGLYPEADFSMRVWIDALTRRANAGQIVTPPVCGSLGVEFENSLAQFTEFYHDKAYGPYRVCVLGNCDSPEVWCDLSGTKFEAPDRGSFQLDVSSGQVKASFDNTEPLRAEANMGIALTSLVIVLMCTACLLLNYSASELAVRPLERMLASIKKSAKAIFSSVNSLGDAAEEDAEDFDETLESEVKLLEQVVKKIATLAELSSKKNLFDEFAMTGMKNEELGVLAMTTATQLHPSSTVDALVDMGEGGTAARQEVTVTMRWQLEEIGLEYEAFNSWNFNPLDWEVSKQKAIAAWMVMNNPGSSSFTEQNVDMKRMKGFIDVVSNGYLPNPYHNLMHAVDVTHGVFRYMALLRAERLFSMLEQYSLLIASFSHDVGHPGVNNGYLTEVQDEIAIRYNDRSPLENMHCCKLFEITADPNTNVFMAVSGQEYKDARKLIIEVILHTDICQHPAMVKELELLYEMNARIFEASPEDVLSEQEVEKILSTAENKKLICKTLLHASDISNPTMPWEISKAWALRVLDEYFAQGDQEKKLGIPMQPLNDRDKVNKPQSQIGFIEYVVAPLVAAEVKLFPVWRDSGLNLETNLKRWEQAWLEEEVGASEQEREKVHERVTKVVNQLNSIKEREPQNRKARRKSLG